MHVRNIWRGMLLALLLLALLAGMAHAQGTERKTVRVGWYESPFEMMDAHGRRSGYAYEYQQRIAAYTGWVYEYEVGVWSELIEKLIAGEIDLMSDVSYTDERAEQMLFSSLPMGTEDYFLYAAPDNNEISKDDYATLNGKRIGVNRGSIQVGLFRDWSEKNGVEAELMEMTKSEDEYLDMLNRGEIDLFLTLDIYGGDVSRAVPVCKIGSSEYFFAVSKSRPDLLAELNAAMGKIHDVNRYYNQEMFFKYFSASGVNLYLDGKELAWLAEHGTIRVGYQDGYLAFCARDPATGELTGALKDYLAFASNCLENARLDFEAVAYPSAEAAMTALKNGEVDCMFPANLTDYDGEMNGVFMLPTIIRTDISAVVRKADKKTFAEREQVSVAVNLGNLNYDMFLLDHFPQWQPTYYANTGEGLKAVADGKADCLLISNYRYNNIARLCEKYKLISLSTGVEMDYSFAVSRENQALYSILSKAISVVPGASVNSALSYYFTEDGKTSLSEYLKEYWEVILAGLAAVLLIFALLLLHSVRADKRANAGQKLISATETDHLTGLYNRSYFYEYAHRLYQEEPDRLMDAVVLNIERFHSINATNGHGFGDEVLRALGEEIRAFLEGDEGIAGRSIGDRFAIYCPHMADSRVLFNRLQSRMDALSPNISIQLRMGVSP